LNGSLFNMFGNTAAITTPIVIGYIVQGTGSFDGALIFIGANALVAVFCYLVIVGEIKRAEIVRR
jgi:ACS family glucarate transporter-like MFS transporter